MDKQSSLAAFVEAYFQAWQSDNCNIMQPREVERYSQFTGKPIDVVRYELKSSIGFQIAYKRFHEFSDAKLDMSLLTFIAIHAETPGETIMFCSYCFMKGIQNIDQFFLDVGLVTYPIQKDFRAAWDSQKCRSGNALDDGKAVLAYRTKLLE